MGEVGCEGSGVVDDKGGGEIERNKKSKSEYGTCDKNILIPLSIKIHKDVPFLMKQKRGFFLPPYPLYVPMSPSRNFFLQASFRYLSCMGSLGHAYCCI